MACITTVCIRYQKYDTKNHFIKTDELESSLKGSLVHVYFELRHYAIKSKRTDSIAGNTFSAISTQVKVLERGSEQCRSPYKSMLLKGPTIHLKKKKISFIQQMPSSFSPVINLNLSSPLPKANHSFSIYR